MTVKIALVTGAAQGIGNAIVRRLAADSMQVAAFDIDTAGLQALAADLDSANQRVQNLTGGCVRPPSCDAAVAQVEQQLGPIDVLVNVAGVIRPWRDHHAQRRRVGHDLRRQHYRRVLPLRAVARRMIPRQAGAIVTVSSNAASTPRMHGAAYASSKAAATMFTKCLGLELAQHNIRCNIVSPGATDTPMQRSLWQDEHSAQKIILGAPDAFRLGIPLHKLATPADIADASRLSGLRSGPTYHHARFMCRWRCDARSLARIEHLWLPSPLSPLRPPLPKQPPPHQIAIICRQDRYAAVASSAWSAAMMAAESS